MAEYDSAIPPGGTGKVKVEVRTRGIQGRRTKSVRLDTNDPEKPRVHLRVTFHSESPVEVYPRPRANLYGFAGRPVDDVLIVHRPDGEPLELGSARCTRPEIEVSLESVDASNADPHGPPRGARPGDWRIRLSVGETDRPVTGAGSLTVETNHPERSVLRLPVRLNVRPEIVVQPRQLSVRARAGSGPVLHRAVTLRHGGRRPFRVTAVRVEGGLPGTSAEPAREVAAPRQQVDIRIDPERLRPGSFAGKLVVETDNEGVRTVSVPFRLVVAESPGTAGTPADESSHPGS